MRYRQLDTLYFFFFNDTATTEIYTLSLHDALPIYSFSGRRTLHPSGNLPVAGSVESPAPAGTASPHRKTGDRKSTRLNSSHSQISYAVFCLKKKKYKYNILSYYVLANISASVDQTL